MNPIGKRSLAWLCCSSVLAFALFGIDKFMAGREGGRRVSEFQLALIGALGGWFGGLLGMLVFRHKTAKLSFKVSLPWPSWCLRGWFMGLLRPSIILSAGADGTLHRPLPNRPRSFQCGGAQAPGIRIAAQRWVFISDCVSL